MDPIKQLKQNILEEYKIFLKNAHCGKIVNYDHIMNMIYYLETQGDVMNSEFIYSKLINK